MMKRFVALFIILVLSACGSTPAEAKPHAISWTWPDTNCDGTVLLQADFVSSEMIYSTSPMPMPSDTEGPCGPTPDGPPPAGALSVPINVATNTTELNLQPGQQYYVRINVCAYTAGNCSSWSAEHTFVVPYGKPQRVIISDAWHRYTYETIPATHTYLGPWTQTHKWRSASGGN